MRAWRLTGLAAALVAGLAACVTLPPRLTPNGVLVMNLAGSPWALRVILPGFTIEKYSTRPWGAGRAILATNDETGFIVSVFLEREPGLGTAEACREFYWTRGLRSPIPKTRIFMHEVGSKASVSWTAEYEHFRQLHRQLFLAADDLCVDIHVSKVNPKPDDDGFFAEIFASARLERR